MMDSINISAVTQVVDLVKNNTFSRSLYLPSEEATPDVIKDARRRLSNHMTSIIGRARQRKERRYKLHTTVSLTTDYDTVITGVVIIEPKRSKPWIKRS